MSAEFEDLLAKARDGKREAIEALLAPQLGALTAFVRLRIDGGIARRESAADVVQSVCREVLGDLESLRARDERGFRAWLFALVANKLSSKRDWHRAARRDVRRELALDAAIGPAPLLGAYSRAATPSRAAEAKEEVARIEDAFDRLPEHYRDVLVLVSIAELSYAETAAVLDRSEDSVRQITHRARARLATLLE
ncbi:MAG: RNA polymerase sigma factor [Planctomycetota bacterium]